MYLLWTKQETDAHFKFAQMTKINKLQFTVYE